MPVNPAAAFQLALTGFTALVAVSRMAHMEQAREWEGRVRQKVPDADRSTAPGAGIVVQHGQARVRFRLESFAAPLADGSTVVEVAVPAPLPTRLVIGPAGIWGIGGPVPVRTGRDYLDAVFRVTSDDPDWARAVLQSEDIGPELRRLKNDVGGVALDRGVLRLAVPHPLAADEVRPLARRIADLAWALGRAGVARWAEAARDHALKLVVKGPRELHLHDESVAVAFRATSWADPGLQVLRMVVPGVPADLTLLPRSPDEPGGRSLGDLILDRGLRVEAGPPDVAERLATDAVRGPLLDFLHGPYEPRVVQGHLELRATGGAAPVVLDRLADMRALREVLAAAWR